MEVTGGLNHASSDTLHDLSILISVNKSMISVTDL